MQRVAQRTEEVFHDEVSRAGVGAHVGGGSGVVYAYVELALTDVPAAIPVLRATAARLGLPARSWLLFHDRDLRGEWVGLRDLTPRPPFQG